ncbi:MAG: hypothetical protein AAF191_03245, partial [Verrucomicrobiota bacterium]
TGCALLGISSILFGEQPIRFSIHIAMILSSIVSEPYAGAHTLFWETGTQGEWLAEEFKEVLSR